MVASRWPSNSLSNALHHVTAQDLAEGKGRETWAIEYPMQSAARISYHPAAAPLHKIRTDDMLPLRLLTPFQVGTPDLRPLLLLQFELL